MTSTKLILRKERSAIVTKTHDAKLLLQNVSIRAARLGAPSKLAVLDCDQQSLLSRDPLQRHVPETRGLGRSQSRLSC